MARQDPGEPYARIDSDEASAMVQEAVSYTHLTLPTILLV